jgi:DNA-binding response OmpR family regulator
MILTELGDQVLKVVLKINGRPGPMDLLFTEVVLPGRTGRMLAHEAKGRRADLRVLYTTGYSHNAIIHHGRLDAGTNLITKSFTVDQLAVRVRDVLNMA